MGHLARAAAAAFAQVAECFLTPDKHISSRSALAAHRDPVTGKAITAVILRSTALRPQVAAAAVVA
jgi:hypothetical protein